MSNHLAIATVTGTLQHVLANAASAVPGADVAMKRPDGSPAGLQGAGINIFLYQVTPDAAYRNADLPTRRTDGQLSQRPQAALVLHYLLSFFGDEGKLEPQRLLGAAIRDLHGHPLLVRQDITDAIDAIDFASPETGLATSNLADQVDVVRFTPLNLSLEELSKVWSIFFQTPYLLSVAYQASAVLLESDEVPVERAPVRTRGVYVVPFRQPVVERVSSAAGAGEPIVSGTVLRITGKRLRADTTLVLLRGVERVPETVTDTEVSVKLPADVPAGAHGLQIIQKLTMGAAPGTAHRGFESNVGTFVLRPRITPPVAKTALDGIPALRLDLDVTVGQKQRVVLLLNSTSAANPAASSFVAKPRDADSPKVTVPIPNVDPGTYFVTVQIDGAASPLNLDPSSATFGPTVTLP